MTTNEAPPSAGLIAGKYQLVRLIGRGGMGSVWEARHVSLGTPSAIKFIESEYSDSQEARSRFDKEARAAATIQSKHAIQIYDHGVSEDGKPYIVMELLQGEPLDKRIERLSRLSLQDTARILQQVGRALARAHERGIIHRDLKPENIFIVQTPDDDEEVAKVLDFGIAKMQSGPGNMAMTSSTKTGAVLGTPFYMSPEQARGLRSVDHRTDLWSLGVIAFKCVTGKLPFDGESIGDLLVKICTAPIPVPSQIAAGIPPNFDAWFMRAMEREPERRFGTVTELSDALCFAAGIATRSGAGTPGSWPGVNNGGAATPNGMVPPREGYPSANGPTHERAQPEAHAAMTNAPFTAESIPGLPSGKSKLLVGMIGGGVAIAATVVGLLLLRKPPNPHTVQANGGVVEPRPTSIVSNALPSETTTHESITGRPAATPGVSDIAAKTTQSGEAVASKSIAKTPAPPTSKTSPIVKPTVSALPPPITEPTPPPPTPAPPTKKRDKNDPGY